VAFCSWCSQPIPDGARSDSVFCGKICRQRAWRLRARRAELAERPERAARPLRMAYADPPYPGLSRRYYADQPSFAGEVDHVALIERLQAYDGWALSTGEFALRDLLPLCPYGARALPWVKPMRPSSSTYGVQTACEYLIVVPGRRLRPSTCGWLHAAPARLGGSTLKGRKPLKFIAWMFGCLGLLPGDELEDLFPGSGAVTRAWAEVQRVAGDVGATRRQEQLRDRLPATGRSAPPARDASRVGRRRRVPLGLPAER
jgi:hypothetical protein